MRKQICSVTDWAKHFKALCRQVVDLVGSGMLFASESLVHNTGPKGSVNIGLFLCQFLVLRCLTQDFFIFLYFFFFYTLLNVWYLSFFLERKDKIIFVPSR